MKNTHPILFDLDGTLVDTAQDMAYVLNQILTSHQLTELPFASIRPHVGKGARALIQLGLNGSATPADETALVHEYMALYEKHSTSTTRLFPGVDQLLHYLDDTHIPWGIVTNKPQRFTADILKKLELDIRALCVICGDTLTKRKPDPDQLLLACKQMTCSPTDGLYIGDSIVDVQASKAAGMRSLVALYGYIAPQEDPFTWNATGYVHEPHEIIPWLKAHL